MRTWWLGCFDDDAVDKEGDGDSSVLSLRKVNETMPQYCTILCPADEPERVATLVREWIGDRGQISVRGPSENWSSLTIEGDGASLVLNRRVFQTPGDEFARMQGGMWSYFNGVETSHTAIKTDVLARVESFALAIGVVAEPGFDEDAGHFECLFGLAAELDAIIWNGAGVLNAEGHMILDGEGASEIEESTANGQSQPDADAGDHSSAEGCGIL